MHILFLEGIKADRVGQGSLRICETGHDSRFESNSCNKNWIWNISHWYFFATFFYSCNWWWRRLPTMSHRKLVDQYTVGLTPLTNCRCLELEILSSIKIITKLAGIKDMAKITQVATNTSALLLNLKQEETAWPCWQTHSIPLVKYVTSFYKHN